MTTGVECTQCDTSNHFVLSLSQCVLCPPNIAFFDSVSSQCVSCEDKFGEQCAQCTQNECEECENGFFAKNGDCALCTNGCELCHSETLCLRCSDRWTLREDGSCKRDDECADCECLSEKKTNDANALQMYLDKQCHKMKQISDFVFSIKMLSVLSVLLSVVGNRIIGVEMMGVLQLAHLVLAHYGDPQHSPIGLTEISTWRWAHGGWIQRLPPQNSNKDDGNNEDSDVINVPNARILGILFTASFFWDNIVMISVTLVMALLALISHSGVRSPKEEKVSRSVQNRKGNLSVVGSVRLTQFLFHLRSRPPFLSLSPRHRLHGSVCAALRGSVESPSSSRRKWMGTIF